MTAPSLLGMEWTSWRHFARSIFFHSSRMTSFRDWMLDGEWCSTLFRILHRCSIGFRSGDILGHWITLCVYVCACLCVCVNIYRFKCINLLSLQKLLHCKVSPQPLHKIFILRWNITGVFCHYSVLIRHIVAFLLRNNNTSESFHQECYQESW